jgi:hypothetical protein
MNALKPVFASLAKFASPAYYSAVYAQIVANTHKEIVKGSAKPLFQCIAIVGCVGYSMEYLMLGRYHVADKKAIVDKALAEHHH